MVEFGICPVTGVVATGTVTTEIAFVRVVLAMAGIAASRGIAMLGVWLVASIAGSVGMLAQQFEVGEQMIKRCFVESGDVCATSLMIRMARGTRSILNITRFAMKSFAVVRVIRNIFVAIEAELILLGAVERFVT